MGQTIDPEGVSFAAVCGFDEDGESAMWGFCDDSVTSAALIAGDWYRRELIATGDSEPGRHRTHVFEDPVWVDDAEGNLRIVSHRARWEVELDIDATAAAVVGEPRRVAS